METNCVVKPAETKRGRARSMKGMTLIEIMIVVAIIGLVMGAVAVGAVAQLQKAQCKTAWSEAQTIGQAIASYQTDNTGDCPKSLEDLVSGKYLSKQPLDPWNQMFQFKCPGDKMTDGADIWSSGKNKNNENGSGDDVNGWLKMDETCKSGK